MGRLATVYICALSAGCYTGLSAGSDPDGSTGATGSGGSEATSESEGADPGERPSFLGPGVCIDTFELFRDEVWTRFMATDCHGCHNPSGLANSTPFILHDASHPNYLTENLQTLRTAAAVQIDGVAMPLLKMSEEVAHAGKLRFDVESPEYEALQTLLEDLAEPVVCQGAADFDALFEQLELLDALRTARRATFALVGHELSGDQEDRIRDRGWDVFDEVLDEVMDEPAFPVRIGEIYNEALLTDAFLIRGTNILYSISDQEYPSRDWFQGTADENAGRTASIYGLTKAPLALVEHVVREGLPFSEVLVADYTMVNPQSARVWGLDLSGFADPDDSNEFRPERIPGIPHAGLLNTHAFLNQYPNTETNFNRHRARHSYRIFLGTDVLRLSLRPIDLAAIEDENPTLTHNACAVCHSSVDPVASAFQNWGNTGRYRLGSELEEPWPDDVREAGFNGSKVPGAELDAPLQWLAQRLAANPRFPVAVVKTIFAGLLRQTPLNEPTDPTSESYYEDIIAVALEDAVLKEIALAFEASDFDMRGLVRSLVRSPLYRAVGAAPDTTEEDLALLRRVGMSHPLRPTQLYAKIEQKTGYAWRPDTLGSAPVLRTLELLFGEIDSLDTTTRLAEANGLFSSFVARMADQVACRVVGAEFAVPPEQRQLLPHVSLEDTSEENIRTNLRHLFDTLIDTRPAVAEEEIDDAFVLFEAVRSQGLADIAGGTASTQIPAACRTSYAVDGTEIPIEARVNFDEDYVARAWIAVVVYVLTDHRFLHE